ncbi:hypothetical protein PCA20602_03428 [Pandoraea capi]|uniref:Transposase n=1 Tax=Pandoraea capi TaxID=2508286 RepID=A0ABY6W4Y4_9BURK|nr:hypothetical protein [Pandoraea capi]VVE26654.1 hypothetical protein PCA20602_03428 [Pandoraea capi]
MNRANVTDDAPKAPPVLAEADKSDGHWEMGRHAGACRPGADMHLTRARRTENGTMRHIDGIYPAQKNR